MTVACTCSAAGRRRWRHDERFDRQGVVVPRPIERRRQPRASHSRCRARYRHPFGPTTAWAAAIRGKCGASFSEFARRRLPHRARRDADPRSPVAAALDRRSSPVRQPTETLVDRARRRVIGSHGRACHHESAAPAHRASLVALDSLGCVRAVAVCRPAHNRHRHRHAPHLDARPRRGLHTHGCRIGRLAAVDSVPRRRRPHDGHPTAIARHPLGRRPERAPMTILFDRDVQADIEVATRGALLGPTPAAQRELRAHLAAHGRIPAMDARTVLQLATDSGLTGHGGAGFPLYRKLEAVLAARGRAIVVANGAEGEPASTKDRWLLTRRPHLVLDGLQLVARATKATEAYLYVNDRVPVAALT